MDLLIVVVVVGLALGYAGWKAWGMVKPGPRVGCGCGSTKSGCAGCPISKA